MRIHCSVSLCEYKRSFQTSRVETSFARRWCKRHRSPTSHLQAKNLRIHQYSLILWDAGLHPASMIRKGFLFVGTWWDTISWALWTPCSSPISAGIRYKELATALLHPMDLNMEDEHSPLDVLKSPDFHDLGFNGESLFTLFHFGSIMMYNV